MTREDLQQALDRARFEERCADRYATAATVRAEWQRVHDHTIAIGAERYDPDHRTALQHAQRAERHRATSPNAPARPPDHRHRPPPPRRNRRPAPLHRPRPRRPPPLTDDDHQAVRDLTHHLDTATLRQVMSWLEHTRTAALVPRSAEPAPLARPAVRRSRF